MFFSAASVILGAPRDYLQLGVIKTSTCKNRYSSEDPEEFEQLISDIVKSNILDNSYIKSEITDTNKMGSKQQSPQSIQAAMEREKLYTYIIELSNPETRQNALLELSKKRESVPELAPMLWHSFGTVASLLQEIINIYPAINPATLTAHQSNRVCNALALLQCFASHPDTRSAFLSAHIPLFLYPFLHTVNKTRPFEYLRLTSLGVIGALVKTDEQEVVTFLLTTEIIPLCLRIMESGSELSKTVATFILQKILLDDSGLSYICQTYDRFSHVAMILGKMVLSLAKEPSARLLKHVVRCYLRLSDNPRALLALRQCLPDQLRDGTFSSCLSEDVSTEHWLSQLLKNLETGPPNPTVLPMSNQQVQQDPRAMGMSPLTS
ncbi:CCR4-NOT transcription complex subunit 9 isoform X4 [Trichogramma pretiosum]|uniref:CCR4-NOT transcription complex subunit 9 isoform X4 n=1 Tax=Trichogramma pretiosum TaxID=7493 RepID=UPI0006C97357|nr:CCR4-NOT transcription complex subunit 9 isoform X4 [Trichogramma pretiosum]